MNHDPPARVAFCPLFFSKNGGRLNDNSIPITGELDNDGNPDPQAIRSLCPHPFDCGTCPLMKEWIETKAIPEGWSIGWECDNCLHETIYQSRWLPAFYQSGQDPNLERDDPDFDPDLPKLSGCTRCGSPSSFLQLVLRK